ASPKPPSTSATPATPVVHGDFPQKYKTTDNRNANIGPSIATNGGWSFRNPHMSRCWIAERFKFTGYDTLYIAPTLSKAKYHDDEERLHQLAKENLVIELNRVIGTKNLFTNVVTRESDIQPGARALRLENLILEYSKGGGGARYFVGLYGGGQPVLRV